MTNVEPAAIERVPAIGDRRGSPRFAGHHVRIARLVPGHHVEVIDVSPGGALIETAMRLLPGTHVDIGLQLEGASHLSRVRALVLRCQVSLLDLELGIRYRGALAFEASAIWGRDAASV